MAVRFIAATTLSPTTKQRRSSPLLSVINSCTIILAFKHINDSITLFAALAVSVKTTPTPWVPSNNLIIKGGPPAMSIKSLASLGEQAKPVIGMPTPFLDKNCNARNLSLDLEIPIESFKVNTPIISNCLTTAVP